MAGPWRNAGTSTGGNNPPCGTGTQSSFYSIIILTILQLPGDPVRTITNENPVFGNKYK